MKKLFLLICFVVFGLSLAQAQDYREVVYLKNGSVIKGVVIEQVPGVSLKIQTADGNIFVYQMSEVEKIAKEVPQEQTYQQPRQYGGQSAINLRTAKGFNKGYRPNGYRGFVEFGGAVGLGDYGDGVVSFSTSQGGQISPYFYIGAGIGVDYHVGWETVFIPIFADLRANFLDNNITPYFGMKIGYSVFDGTGVYFNPTIGVDFAMNKKLGFTLSLGYNLQSAEFYSYSYSYYGYYSGTERNIIGGFSLKFGVHF